MYHGESKRRRVTVGGGHLKYFPFIALLLESRLLKDYVINEISFWVSSTE